MRAFTSALVVAILCCSIAQAQVVKFTVVSIEADPPGPHPPGAKFKIKVKVRNDGDTIPAGRRFDFIFTGPNLLSIAPPTGTPANFFGYCPGATPTRMICQCFAEWKNGHTVELEAEVTVGGSASLGTATLTFEVKSGSGSGSASVDVQIVLAGPDLVPQRDQNSIITGTQRRGRLGYFFPRVANIGTAPSAGEIKLTAVLSAGLTFIGAGGSMTFTGNRSIAAGKSEGFDPPTGSLRLRFNEIGVQSVILTVSGGGDVNSSNNIKTFEFEVVREEPDHLTRVDEFEDAQRLAKILGR